MPDKDKEKKEVRKSTEEESVVPKLAFKKLKARTTLPAAPKPKLYTFDQWAARKGVPQHHRGGMRAFVSNVNKSRSLEAWDKLFSEY